MVIEKYCVLALQGVLRMSVSDQPVLLCKEPHSHPIQDPAGSLFLTLLMVRRHRPRGDCWMNGPRENRLKPSYRKDLAAMLSVCHKMCGSSFSLRLEVWVQHLYTQFLYIDELPDFGRDRRYIGEEFYNTELCVLQEPLYSLLTLNPQTTVELLLGRLHESGKLSLKNVKIFRGSTFFLLGSCLLNRREDVLEILCSRYGDDLLAQACVNILMLLQICRGIPLGGFKRKEHEQLTIPPSDDRLDFVSRVILHNAMGRFSKTLRMGPYRADVFAAEPPHPVQRLLRPENLKRAMTVLKTVQPARETRQTTTHWL